MSDETYRADRRGTNEHATPQSDGAVGLSRNPSQDFRAIQEAFTAHVRDPDANPPPPGSKPERMAWYAKLFFNNIDGTLENAFPALRASLDDDDWQGLTRPFFRDHPAHSPILRDLPAEFVDFLQEDPGLADWQRELAAYELTRFDLMAEDADPAPADLDPAGDLLAGRPVVSSLVRLMVTAYPVDRLAAKLEAGETPEIPPAGMHHLALHRDEHGAPYALNLTPGSAQLLLALTEKEGQTGEEVVAALAEAFGRPVDELLGFAAEQLEKWRAQGILLGARLPN
ncbi:putative DNA-binding domain-containing protein [Guyparkeria halophila]|uniref:DNA-binding domain-containing protein n=1 Tax=Guyparkeria halophila TaxID=47960 RepID=A0ABZ0YZ83_9GAMM|nr:putative DNA-binding domain-containing protein [Guyparkeria halophila]WQH16526.1 putative DNA-binding domain-containing protein [Guyparkeria halophila]